jgi:hypothetical protein
MLRLLQVAPVVLAGCFLCSFSSFLNLILRALNAFKAFVNGLLPILG